MENTTSVSSAIVNATENNCYCPMCIKGYYQGCMNRTEYGC